MPLPDRILLLCCLITPLCCTEIRPMSTDLSHVHDRLIELILPARTDPAALAATAAGLIARQAADGTWPDVDYADTRRSAWRTMRHLGHVWALAQQVHLTRQAGNPDTAALAGVRAGLDAWLRLDPRNPNWWHNEIGAPTTLGNILLLLGDAIDADRRAACCAIMQRSRFEKWTGQNLVWGVNVQIMRGCLERNEALVETGFDRFFHEIRIGVPPQEGVLVDASFHQHGNVLYAGGYGQGFSIDGARLIACAQGTRFQAPAAVTAVLSTYLLDGQRWMLRGGMWDFGVVGRELCRSGKSARGLAAAARLMAGLGLPRQAEFAGMATAIANDQPDPGVAGNRHFWCSDYMAHQRPGFFASARMHSRRVDNTDSLTNDENRRSHFLADGAFCLMRDGSEYRDIFSVWDWQRVPGITCEQRPGMPAAKLVRRHGTTAFVGGVSDGRLGLAAMQLQRDTLTAHKTWLFLDDIIVCLGSGITCTSGLQVLTSMNQCLLRGAVERSPPDAAASWLWHDQVGYALLGTGAVRCSTETQHGRWSDIGVGKTDEVSLPVFSASIDHGRDPHDATYAYAVLPGVRAEAMPGWRSTIDVLSNTPALQAVSHPASGVLAAAFHQAGHVPGLAVDKPCLVLLQRSADAVTLSVANPLNQALSVQVDLDLTVHGDGATPTSTGSRVRVDLPGGDHAGSSVVRHLVCVP